MHLWLGRYSPAVESDALFRLISSAVTLLDGNAMRKLLAAVAAVAMSSGVACAADLAARPYTKAPPMIVDPAYNWSGFYLGVNVGYGWGKADTGFQGLPEALFTDLRPTTLSPDPKGVLGGGQIGYNWQAPGSRFVWGLEADIQGADIKGTATVSPFVDTFGVSQGPLSFLQASQKLTWFGTVRARVGVTPVDRLLLYVTGGLAYGHVDYAANTSFLPTFQYVTAFGKTKVGWTAGAGAEWAFAQNWSAKVEYLYLDLGGQSAIAEITPPNPPFSVGNHWDTQAHIVRAGVNYKFGGPVIARY